MPLPMNQKVTENKVSHTTGVDIKDIKSNKGGQYCLAGAICYLMKLIEPIDS